MDPLVFIFRDLFLIYFWRTIFLEMESFFFFLSALDISFHSLANMISDKKSTVILTLSPLSVRRFLCFVLFFPPPLSCCAFFVFSIYCHTCSIWKFLGQGSKWSCSCSLCQSHWNIISELFYNLYYSLQQCWILYPMNKAGDQTCILTVTPLGPWPAEPHRNSFLLYLVSQFYVCLQFSVVWIWYG